MSFLKISIILAFVLCISCESMKDTYEDYCGDGKILYVGKSSDLEIKAGWKRFQLKWKNNLDPKIKNIKIKWEVDDIRDSVIIDGALNEYTTEKIFENYNYYFTVVAMDAEGNESLPIGEYSRPFTYDHEMIKVVSNLEDKYFYLKESLLIIFNAYNEKTINPILEYYYEGKKKTLELTKEIIEKKYLLLNKVDKDKDVLITRSAKLDDCIDIINFEPYKLERNKFYFNSDFLYSLKMTYNLEKVDNEFINNLQELYIDTDLSSLEDIFNFPNLRKIVLGGRRFVDPDYNTDIPCLLDDKETSIYAIEEYNKIKNIELEIFNNQFDILNDISFAVDKGTPALPDFEFLNTKNWEISCTSDIDVFDSNLESILDNDVNSYWKPKEVETTVRSHEITIDMQQKYDINGFCVRLPKIDYQDYFPETIHIQYSKDGANWEEACLQSNIRLNQGRGEATVIKTKSKLNARYIRFYVKDRIGYNQFTYLSDFLVF